MPVDVFRMGDYVLDRGGKGRTPFRKSDGWGGFLSGEEDEHFVYRRGYVFVKAFTLGNYQTPQESNYAFGVYLAQGPRKIFVGDDVICDYDDRLRGFYPERWEAAHELLRARGGGRAQYATAPMDALSDMLSTLYDKSVTCLQVLRGCNVSSGYPFHVFVSREASREPA
jgi:hypothetical protein